MRVERNINDPVLVKLTKAGEDVYSRNTILPREPINEDHVYSFLFWELMYIFGKEAYSTNNLFVNNKMVFANPFDFKE